MKFLADIPFARSIGDALRALGHECEMVRDVLSPTADDVEIVTAAAAGSLMTVEDHRLRIRPLPVR